jgi:hypothetical protein
MITTRRSSKNGCWRARQLETRTTLNDKDSDIDSKCLQNNPIQDPEALKRLDKFFSKSNKRPFRTLGEELGRSRP